MDFAKVLTTVATFCEERQIPLLLVGAFSLKAYGNARETQDLDVLVPESEKATILTFLDGLGYERLHVAEGYSNHVHRLPGLGRLDVIYADRATADLMLARARRLEVLGSTVRVPAPEHLIAMRALAIKNNPARELRELNDIQFLAALPGVDLEEIRSYVRRYGLEARVDAALPKT